MYCGAAMVTQAIYTQPMDRPTIYTAPLERPQDPERWIPVQNQPVSGNNQTVPGKRVRKLPILLAVLVCLVGFFLFSGMDKKTEAILPPVPMPERTEAPAQARLIFEYRAEDLSVTVTENREVTVTVKNLPLREQYTVNLSHTPENTVEFDWSLYAYSPGMTLRFRTYHAKRGYEQSNQVVTLDDMQTTLFMEEKENQYFNVQGVPLEMAHDANSITWTCTLPEEWPAVPGRAFPVDPECFTGFMVKAEEYGNYYNRVGRKYEVK